MIREIELLSAAPSTLRISIRSLSGGYTPVIKRLQRAAVRASEPAALPAADPQRRWTARRETHMEYWSEIIAEASKSPLGIFALMILVVSGLAVTYFRKAQLRVRVSIFILIFAGVVAYAISLSQMLDDGPKQVEIPGDSDPNGATGGRAYNRIQGLFLRAKNSNDCSEIVNLLSQIEKFSENSRPVPRSARESVRFPSTPPDKPTIADLSRDRIWRIEKRKPGCVK